MVLKGRPEEHDAPLGQIQTVQVKEEALHAPLADPAGQTQSPLADRC